MVEYFAVLYQPEIDHSILAEQLRTLVEVLSAMHRLQCGSESHNIDIITHKHAYYVSVLFVYMFRM